MASIYQLYNLNGEGVVSTTASVSIVDTILQNAMADSVPLLFKICVLSLTLVSNLQFTEQWSKSAHHSHHKIPSLATTVVHNYLTNSMHAQATFS